METCKTPLKTIFQFEKQQKYAIYWPGFSTTQPRACLIHNCDFRPIFKIQSRRELEIIMGLAIPLFIFSLDLQMCRQWQQAKKTRSPVSAINSGGPEVAGSPIQQPDEPFADR